MPGVSSGRLPAKAACTDSGTGGSRRQSSHHSSSETSSGILPLPLSAPSYFKRRVLPRKVSRVIFWGLVSIAGLCITCFSFHRMFDDKVPVQSSRCDFPLKEADPDTRPHEHTNTFATYKHFGEKCDISSLELHRPYEPICPNRPSMLTAMSSVVGSAEMRSTFHVVVICSGTRQNRSVKFWVAFRRSFLWATPCCDMSSVH